MKGATNCLFGATLLLLFGLGGCSESQQDSAVPTPDSFCTALLSPPASGPVSAMASLGQIGSIVALADLTPSESAMANSYSSNDLMASSYYYGQRFFEIGAQSARGSALKNVSTNLLSLGMNGSMIDEEAYDAGVLFLSSECSN